MTTVDQRLVGESLTHLLTSSSDLQVIDDLADSGWCELYDADPRVAVTELFAAQGACLRSTPMIGVLLALALRDGPAPPGGLTTHALIPVPAGGSEPPATMTKHEVVIHGCNLAGGRFDRVLVVARTTSGSVRLIELDETAPDFAEVEGLDPALGLRLRSERLPIDSLRVSEDVDDGRWERAVATCRIALGHELVAAAELALELAVAHAREREQFGQPIGSFQAIQHRLADATVAIEVARLALDNAWQDVDAGTALIAKAWAGRAARETVKQAQQVLGGMGFTWEHRLHKILRRILTLDALLGSVVHLEYATGAALMRDRHLPALRPL
jgi:hypothetical protein